MRSASPPSSAPSCRGSCVKGRENSGAVTPTAGRPCPAGRSTGRDRKHSFLSVGDLGWVLSSLGAASWVLPSNLMKLL